MRRPVSSVTNFVARLFAAVCAAGSGDIGAGVVALCCKGVSAARASRKSHANTPQANVSAITKNRRLASLAAKIFPRAIKKPREQSEASRHTLSRGECQLRPVRVGSLTFDRFAEHAAKNKRASQQQPITVAGPWPIFTAFPKN